MMILSVKQLTHFSRFAPLKVRQTGYRSQEGIHGTTRTNWARVCLEGAHVCLRDSSCGGGHPSDRGGPRFGSVELVTDLPPPIFAFVLRAPTCAIMCSYSVCWA